MQGIFLHNAANKRMQADQQTAAPFADRWCEALCAVSDSIEMALPMKVSENMRTEQIKQMVMSRY